MNWLEKAKKFERCSRKVYDKQTDTYHCAHCGKIFDGVNVKWTYDHYLPNSMNGMTNAENLFPVCLKCNGDRKDVLVDGRKFYKYISKEAYNEMIESISHKKVMVLLGKKNFKNC